jgi:hypothetical protein
MSQEGILDVINSHPSIPISFVTESGTATPAANVLNIFSGSNLTTTGSGNTVTISLASLQNHSLVVGSGTAAFTNLGVATNGQIPIGSAGADPVLNTITAGTGITVTNGAGTITVAVASGAAVVQTLTGNSGGAISPTAGNINTLGTGSITIAGSGSTLTTQLTGLTNHNVLVGAGTATITNVAPSATSGVPLISQGAASDPAFGTAVVAGGGTGSTSFNTTGVVISGATSTTALSALTLTDGQLVIGSSIGAPAAATLTAGSGISITNGHNTISIAVTSGATVVETLTGNSGGAISPTSGNINTLGTGSITIVGSGSTLTTQLTGLTAHNILLGEGTATVGLVAPTANTGAVLQNNSGADPTYSTATYPSTTTINQILYSSSANVVAGLATANNGVLTTGTTGIPVITALASNGQLIIGSGSGAPLAATLTAGTGISITNAANSITIASTGNPMVWTDESASFNAAAGNGYFVTNTATATLPASPAQGNIIKFIATAAHVVTIQANTGQSIRIGSAISSSAGTATSSGTAGDALTLVYQVASTTWYSADAPQNVWTTA